MSQEGHLGTDSVSPWVFYLLVVLVIVGYVVAVAYQSANESMPPESWCDDENETRTMEKSIVDGGLHCEHSNGSLVHYPKDFSDNNTSEAS